MSRQLINHNADLRRLQDEGFDLEIKSNHLLVKRIPYLNSQRIIEYGTLVTVLEVVVDKTIKPQQHVAFFIGEFPCDCNGSRLESIFLASVPQNLGQDLTINHSLSNRPPEGYTDYYEKVKRYVDIIVPHAQAINPDVNATPHPLIEADVSERGPFHYMDTASTRARIGKVSEKLAIDQLAIVGLGGTGSYVLDLVSKTMVKMIHLFDGDKYSQHNAFRSPGAASPESLKAEPKKVAYLAGIYGQMHTGIVPHDIFINKDNVNELKFMNFVFLCLDRGYEKQAIVTHLEALNIPFIDVGMGVQMVDDSLSGTLRVTTSTPGKRTHVATRIPFNEFIDNDEYSQNIQIADLNMMNAAMAVMRWKKLYGFYHDFRGEHHVQFTTNDNVLVSEEVA